MDLCGYLWIFVDICGVSTIDSGIGSVECGILWNFVDLRTPQNYTFLWKSSQVVDYFTILHNLERDSTIRSSKLSRSNNS